ncbi:hypothetical protein C8R43DRAFT_964756 [Mycena crocata]|nr:hypothetical protein C8R43DRAFT_964756 [Mycena crocata]
MPQVAPIMFCLSHSSRASRTLTVSSRPRQSSTLHAQLKMLIWDIYESYHEASVFIMYSLLAALGTDTISFALFNAVALTNENYRSPEVIPRSSAGKFIISAPSTNFSHLCQYGFFVISRASSAPLQNAQICLHILNNLYQMWFIQLSFAAMLAFDNPCQCQDSDERLEFELVCQQTALPTVTIQSNFKVIIFKAYP